MDDNRKIAVELILVTREQFERHYKALGLALGFSWGIPLGALVMQFPMPWCAFAGTGLTLLFFWLYRLARRYGP